MATISEPMAPPRPSTTIMGWLKKNLFSTWYNALLTLGSLGLIYGVLHGLLTWMLTKARWEVVTTNLVLFLVGPFPRHQIWRIGVCGAMVLVLGVLSGVAWSSLGSRWAGVKWARRGLVIGWVLSFPVTIILLRGFNGSSILPPVGTNLWGGLLLTFLLAIVSIVASFPLGVLLALGRRSELPAIRWFCILYIEVVRGVPLITVLFMVALMLPLLLSEEVRVDKVIRAMAGFTLFTAAYIAENVRGGLAAVPVGQYEAARALGFSEWQVMGLIVLPQALRAVIPPIVGQFIALFKDTSLVVIMGLLDLLNIGRSVVAQPEFIGLQREVYLFIAVIYFIFSYGMSYASRRLEMVLGVGKR